MILYDLTKSAIDAAAAALPFGSVVMVNHLWFRQAVAYTEDVADRQPDPRSALYLGYASAFAKVAAELGVTGVSRIFVGHRAADLVAGPEDDWDDVVIVRYRSFCDFRTIVESEQYAVRAKPHHRAAVASWRIAVTTE